MALARDKKIADRPFGLWAIFAAFSEPGQFLRGGVAAAGAVAGLLGGPFTIAGALGL